MSIEPYIAEYPWLAESRNATEELDRSLMWKNEVVRQRAVERVVTAVNDGHVGDPLYDRRTDEKFKDNDQFTLDIDVSDIESEDQYLYEFLSYPAARIIVSLIDDHRVANHYAHAEAHSARERLTVAEDADDDDVGFGGNESGQGLYSTPTLDITEAFDEFGVELTTVTPIDQFTRSHTADYLENASKEDVKSTIQAHFNSRGPTVERATERIANDIQDGLEALLARPNMGLNTDEMSAYSMSVTDYTSLAAHLKEDKWRLANRDVADGRVTLTGQEPFALAEDAIFQRVADRLPFDVPDEVAAKFTDEPGLVFLAEQHIDEDAFSFEIDRVEEGLFPPVMKSLLGRVQSGDHMTHEERFAIAAFLVNLGMSTDEIVEMFGVSGHFAEDPTRYQVNHIQKGGGGGEPYTPPTYATLESWGVEWEKDALEEKVKHPLQYYRVKLRDSDHDTPEEMQPDDESGTESEGEEPREE